ncbi:MAG: thioredoxin family protein [Verrucomicrobiota bacterium]
MKNTIIALATFVLAGSLSASVATGQKAPDFTLTDTNGVQHSLSDFAGKTVVLEWLNHGCPFVVRHYESGNMQGLQDRYGDKGVVWLSIVSSAPGKQGYYPPEKANEITADYEATPAAVLIDSTGDVGRLYSAETTPHMYVINPDGVLVYQGAIDDQPRGRDPSQANNFVANALDASMAGEPIPNGTTRPYGCSVKY